MAKKENQEKFKTMIGGQALIEGIMMMGPEKTATVVRTKDELKTKIEDRKPIPKYSVKKVPFLRGIFNFCSSMKVGTSALMYSAEFFGEDEEEESGKQSKFDAWLEKKLSSEKAKNALITVAVFIGILFSVGLFVVLPSLIGSFINRFITENELVRNLLEGVVRIVIFLSYLFLVSRMKDMKRTFAYHGAEHKSIRCYEAKLPLTVENVRKQTRLHPRCGTSFLLIVMILSILLFSVASSILLSIVPKLPVVLGGWFRVVMIAYKLLLLPLVVSVSYEINRWVGRHDNRFTRILTAPGMWFQNFTTNEPDDEMIEVGIAALEAVLPENKGEDQW